MHAKNKFSIVTIFYVYWHHWIRLDHFMRIENCSKWTEKNGKYSREMGHHQNVCKSIRNSLLIFAMVFLSLLNATFVQCDAKKTLRNNLTLTLRYLKCKQHPLSYWKFSSAITFNFDKKRSKFNSFGISSYWFPSSMMIRILIENRFKNVRKEHRMPKKNSLTKI